MLLDPFDQVVVVFVDDLADDLFQHVLDRDQARHAAELVQHHGHVVAVRWNSCSSSSSRLVSGTNWAGRSSPVRSPPVVPAA